MTLSHFSLHLHSSLSHLSLSMAGVDLELTLVDFTVDELEGGELVELLVEIVEAYFISFIRCFLI